MNHPEPVNLDHLLARLEAAERRGRARSVLGGMALVLSLILVSSPPAAARQLGVTLASLAAQVAQLRSDLKAETNARTSVDDDLQGVVAYLGTRAAALEGKTKYLSVSGTNTVFSGTNVLVQSGSGGTDGPVNGLGNLIVGYDENVLGYARTGSHNLIVGLDHGYTSYGGAVFGIQNRIANACASALGGEANLARGESSVALGGIANVASGADSVVSGGGANTASNSLCVVSGGAANLASGHHSVVSGGEGNTASGLGSVVSGGGSNRASENYAAVGGGQGNGETRAYGWKASSGLTN